MKHHSRWIKRLYIIAFVFVQVTTRTKLTKDQYALSYLNTHKSIHDIYSDEKKKQKQKKNFVNQK